MEFVDCHAHLDSEVYKNDRQAVLQKSQECGVKYIITSGVDKLSSVEAVKIAEDNDGVFASIGIYPEYINDYNDDLEIALKILAKSKKVVAIGEIGLQYTDNMPSREEQKEGLVRQLILANDLSLPIVIHCRDAYGDMIEVLKANKNLLTSGGTMHCYSGSKEIAKELLKLGFYISVGGVSTFKNAENLRETLQSVPIDRLLLETDSPYLTPHPYRGQRNSPCYIPTIAENLAKVKGVSVEEIARITTDNARRLFRLC